MIIDDIYINQDQITKIKYNQNFSEALELEVYEVSKFKLVAINEEEIIIYLLKNKIWTQNARIYSEFHREEYLLEKGKLKNANKKEKNLKNVRGWIKVHIELSSGSMHETTVQDFEDIVEINGSALYGMYKESKFGVKFNPSEVNIEYVCDILFKNKKQYKKEKVMI